MVVRSDMVAEVLGSIPGFNLLFQSPQKCVLKQAPVLTISLIGFPLTMDALLEA